MTEDEHRKRLLVRIVAGSFGEERVRAVLANAPIGELEAMVQAADENAGLTHLQQVWKADGFAGV